MLILYGKKSYEDYEGISPKLFYKNDLFPIGSISHKL